MRRPASREVWSGHSMTSLEGTQAAMVSFVSPSNLASSSPPSSQAALRSAPAAASHVTAELGPAWLLLREQRETHLDLRTE